MKMSEPFVELSRHKTSVQYWWLPQTSEQHNYLLLRDLRRNRKWCTSIPINGPCSMFHKVPEKPCNRTTFDLAKISRPVENYYFRHLLDKVGERNDGTIVHPVYNFQFKWFPISPAAAGSEFVVPQFYCLFQSTRPGFGMEHRFVYFISLGLSGATPVVATVLGSCNTTAGELLEVPEDRRPTWTIQLNFGVLTNSC